MHRGRKVCPARINQALGFVYSTHGFIIHFIWSPPTTSRSAVVLTSPLCARWNAWRRDRAGANDGTLNNVNRCRIVSPLLTRPSRRTLLCEWNGWRGVCSCHLLYLRCNITSTREIYDNFSLKKTSKTSICCRRKCIAHIIMISCNSIWELTCNRA